MAKAPIPRAVQRFTDALTPYAMLPVRFAAGLTFVLHGWPKVSDLGPFVDKVVDLGIPYGEPLAWAAALIEFLGGMALIVGFFSRWFAFAGMFIMGVAIAYVHWGQGYFASEGGIELPLLQLLLLLGVWLGGSGRGSVDSIRGRL